MIQNTKINLFSLIPLTTLHYVGYLQERFNTNNTYRTQTMFNVPSPYRVSLLDITETRITITVWTITLDRALELAIELTNGGHAARLA